MNRKKLMLLFGALFLVWAVNAQSTENNPSPDTAHHHMMHHHWNNRSGGPDSLARHSFRGSNGFHRPGNYAYHGSNGFHRPYGFHRPGDWAYRGGNGFHRRYGFRGHSRIHRPGAFRNRGYAFRGRQFGPGRHGAFNHYSPQQRQQAMAINKDYRQKRADLYKQDNITLKQYKEGLVALEKDRKAKLQALLTPEQKSAMDARRKRMDDNRQVMAAAHLERLRLNLNLSDDQVARIKAGQQDLRSKARAIHENDDLLPQEKRAQMKALMATRNDNFKSILTPEQYMKFQQMGHRRFGGPWQGHGSSNGRTTS